MDVAAAAKTTIPTSTIATMTRMTMVIAPSFSGLVKLPRLPGPGCRPASDHTRRRTPSTRTTWTGAPAGKSPLIDWAVQVSLLTLAIPVGARSVRAMPSAPGRPAGPRRAKPGFAERDGR